MGSKKMGFEYGIPANMSTHCPLVS